MERTHKFQYIAGYTIGGWILRNRLQERTSDGDELWECECRSCGSVKTLRKGNIKKTQSCGCLKHENITGRRFGRLTAICPTAKRDRRQVVWKFRCDCGVEVEKPIYLVKSGSISSCGCLAQELALQNLKKGIAMGTRLDQICIEGDPPQRNNTSGNTGVWLDSSRNRYMVRMEFQGVPYRTYVYDEEEAKQLRKNYVAYRHDFLNWWRNLTPQEQAFENERYQTKNKMGPLFLNWLKDHLPPV